MLTMVLGTDPGLKKLSPHRLSPSIMDQFYINVDLRCFSSVQAQENLLADLSNLMRYYFQRGVRLLVAFSITNSFVDSTIIIAWKFILCLWLLK